MSEPAWCLMSLPVLPVVGRRQAVFLYWPAELGGRIPGGCWVAMPDAVGSPPLDDVHIRCFKYEPPATEPGSTQDEGRKAEEV